MKQTAVEWLVENLITEFRFSFSDNILEQAKEMEKQQIIESYEDGYIDSDNNLPLDSQYYNETFKK